MRNMKKAITALACAAVLGSINIANAGVLYFDYNANTLGGSTNGSLFLFGKSNQTATVTNSAGFNEMITFDSSGFYNLGIPSLYQQTGTGIRNTGFKVTSNEKIAGYFINRKPFTTDMTYLLDSEALGTQYTVASMGDGFGEGSQVAIHATEDNTVVTFTPKGGSIISVVLNAGETYKYAGGANDLTGSSISSDKPVAVFSGHECAQVPSGITACDTLLEQAIPNDKLSKKYLLSASEGAEVSYDSTDLVRVIAIADNTEIKIDGVVVATINAGEFYEFSLSSNSGASVEATEKVAIAQYLKGGEGADTDPAFSYVPGLDTWLKEYRLATPAGSAAFNNNYASVVIKSGDVSSLKLNNTAIDTSLFSMITGTDYLQGIIDLPLGLFDLKASSEFLVMLGGGSSADSYFTYGGSTFAPGISPPTDPDPIPVPASLFLVGLGLGGLAMSRRVTNK